MTDLRGPGPDADRQAIYRAMANLRPRPTPRADFALARRCPEHAARAGDQAPPGRASGRLVRGGLQPAPRRRHLGTARTEAERTEVEPEQNLQIWSGWDCEPICAWMMGQLDQADPAQPPPEPPPKPPREPPAEEPAAGRAQLTIDSATIIDADGRADVVTAGALAADPPRELVAPVRVVLAVSGARPGTRVQAVTRILRPDDFGWNPRHPVVVPDSGQAEFDLSESRRGSTSWR